MLPRGLWCFQEKFALTFTFTSSSKFCCLFERKAIQWFWAANDLHIQIWILVLSEHIWNDLKTIGFKEFHEYLHSDKTKEVGRFYIKRTGAGKISSQPLGRTRNEGAPPWLTRKRVAFLEGDTKVGDFFGSWHSKMSVNFGEDGFGIPHTGTTPCIRQRSNICKCCNATKMTSLSRATN